MKTGISANAGSKIDVNTASLKAQDQMLEKAWQRRREELIAEGKDWKSPEMANTWLTYTRQKIANTPPMNAAARLLLAQDEAAKVVYGSGVATGRTFREAQESGIKRGTAEFQKMLDQHMKEVFRDGIRTGKIIDPEVLNGSKALTFQADIPLDGNPIDQAFAGLERAASKSAFWTWVSPFTRMTYNTLEQGGVFLQVLSLYLMLESSCFRIPRYKKILNGEMGEVAEMQLRSNLAFAQYWSYSVGALAYFGNITGNNPPPGMPKKSFIVPVPGSAKGWVGVPYDRIEPIATPTS